MCQSDSTSRSGWKCGLEDGTATFELLFDENLNEQRKENPDAQLLPITIYIPEARYLCQFNLQSTIAIDRYYEIQTLIDMDFPIPQNYYYPEQDENFFERLIAENKLVFAIY